MSRRTKLIITALFLVLLAIPVVYTVLTWRPENPLRFRIVRELGLQKPSMPSRGLVQAFVVEVRNGSSVPVKLYGAYLYRPTSAASSSRAMIGEIQLVTLLPPHFTPPGEYDTGPIPPGGTVYFMAEVGESADIRLGEAQVYYNSVSRTKGNCIRWYNGIMEYLPLKIREHMPGFVLEEDESTLDVSLLSRIPSSQANAARHPVAQ